MDAESHTSKMSRAGLVSSMAESNGSISRMDQAFPPSSRLKGNSSTRVDDAIKTSSFAQQNKPSADGQA